MDHYARFDALRLQKTSVLYAFLFLIFLLAIVGESPATAQAKAGTASVRLGVHVPVRVQMKAAPPSCSSGVTSAVLPLAPDVVEVRIHVHGSGGPEEMQFPVTVITNVRRFLLRARMTAGSDGTISIFPDTPALISGDGFSGRSRSLNDGGVLAVCGLPGHGRAPLDLHLQISIPAVPKGEIRTIVLRLEFEALGQAALHP